MFKLEYHLGGTMKVSLGEFLKAGRDLQGGEILVINNEGVQGVSDFKNPDGSEKSKIDFEVIMPDGQMKKLTMNKTSMKKLAEAYGMETKAWIGQKAKVTMAMTPQGKQMIILEPVK